MTENNDVFQVLITQNNEPVLPVGKRSFELAPGQVGVFDYDTSVSIDGTKPVRGFYLCVGVDTIGTGVVDNIVKSRGSHIQTNSIRAYSYRPHSAGKPMKVLLSDYTSKCETEYAVKVEIRNQALYMQQGVRPFTKTFSTVTPCCSDCNQVCPSGDSNDITRGLYINIANNIDSFIKANILPRGDVSAAGVTPDAKGYLTLSQLDTILAYNNSQTDYSDYVFTNLEIETIPQKVNYFAQLSMGYKSMRETVVIVTKTEGFKCTGTVETTQEPAFEEGAGIDVRHGEYVALGWDISPYRTSAVTGLANDIAYNSNIKEKYNQVSLSYDHTVSSASIEYKSSLATIVAMPSTDIITQTSLLAVLDKIVATKGFEALSDDATLASTDPTIVEEITTPDKDGLA